MLTSLPTPRTLNSADVPPLGWGIIGTGIARGFVGALHAHTTQKAVAVTARDRRKTEQFANDLGISTFHHNTTALIEDPAVDVVYIATPHPLHRDLAMEAIAAGKHVLIEKPIAMNASEAAEITAAGRAAGVLVTEAMWTRYLPQSDILRQIIADGHLGEIHLVRADFGFVMPIIPDHRLWNPDLGGGALLDAGIYPISFASSILGPPRTVTTVGSLAVTGVDSRATLLLTHSTDAVAIASTSLETNQGITASVMGSNGRIDLGTPFFGPSTLTLSSGALGSREPVTWSDPRRPNPHDALGDQATAFAAYTAEGRTESPLHPHHEIISVMQTIDTARSQLQVQR